MYVPTSMKEYPPILPHGSGRMITLDPRRLPLAFEEHSSQQEVSVRLQKKQEKVPDPITGSVTPRQGRVAYAERTTLLALLIRTQQVWRKPRRDHDD